MNPNRDHRAIILGATLIALSIVVARICYNLSEWSALPTGDAGSRGKNLEELVHASVWWSSLSLSLLAAVVGLWTLVAGMKGRATWLGPRQVHPLLTSPNASAARWFWPALLIILVLGTSLRAPRLDHSFYNDESHTYTRYVAGIWQDYGGENERFRRPPYIDTVFANQIGNIEWPTRIPPFAAGLATILLLALMFRRVGYWQIGLLAALVLALHPWHIRYSSESRSYALALAAMAAGFLFMLRALQTGRWRDWSAHGVFQFLAIWAYPGALVAVALTQLGLGAWMLHPVLRKRELRATALHHLTRWATGGVLALILAAFLLIPGFIQLNHALNEHPATRGNILEGWWSDTLTFVATGCGWQDETPGNPINPTASGSLLIITGMAAFWLLAATGLIRCLRTPALRLVGLLIALQILSLPILYIRADLNDNVLHWWYVLPILPGLVMLAAIGIHHPGRLRIPCLAAAAVLLAGWLPVLSKIIPHGKSDGRQIVRIARDGDFPHYDHRPLTFSLWADVATYDPLMRWLDDNEHLDESISHAEANDLPLFIAVTQEGNARNTHPEVVERLDDPQQFEHVATAWSLESDNFTTHLYRWRGPP